jgi:hypothetical protein
MKINDKLKFLFAEINKAKAARSVGLPVSTISSYIAQGSMPRADIALKIARASGVSLEWLVDDAQGMPPVLAASKGLAPLPPATTPTDHARRLIHHAADTLSGGHLFHALAGVAEAVAAAEKQQRDDGGGATRPRTVHRD